MATTDLKNLPPVPYKTPMQDESGFLSEPWSKWFRQAFARMGGVDAPTNKDLQSSNTGALLSLQTSVAVLQSQVSSLQLGLGNGPVL